ncbi:ABC transporter permease [Bacillus sp. PS06]|uniref:ABC transporter permease n=1 Tax=Bacillus sp. PS06 TaxID=2764176 RepID=UPI00177AF12C|nr:ABC transporter permease subunit [Bacillus sp. PS06]MBD8069474.1 ABC transporter permease [Bacillus sp. PS06]
MKQWFVLFTKEWVEMTRNYKLIWIPLVFILFGIMQPVTSYFLPEILKSAGGLPEGAVSEFPLPSPAEVMAQTNAQISQIGFLILALAFMGIITSERASGVQDLILVKPVSLASYVTAKWMSVVVLGFTSYVLGILAAYYYTVQLIGDIDFGYVLSGMFTYAVWLILVITFLLFYSTFMKSSGMVAFLTLGTTMLLSLATSLLSKWMMWSPARLVVHSASLFNNGEAEKYYALSFTVAIVLIGVLISAGIVVFKRTRNG